MTLSIRSLAVALAGAFVITGCQVAPQKPDTSEGPQYTESVPEQRQTAVTSSETHASTYLPKNTEATVQSNDLWQLTRQNFKLDLDQAHPRIEARAKWFTEHPRYVNRVVERASRYYYYILHETLKRGLPAELALLPIVESAYDPFAYSPGHAAGPWQFIPSTGKHFGLKQTWWYDGRRDIVASTQAALTYLEQLHDRFNDWELALAAYNAGGGNVSLAMKRNRRADKPLDFWSLQLPAETREYVPKLLAVARVIRNPENYGVTLKPIPNTPYFAEIDVQTQIDLAEAAKLANITTQELYLLNPGFERWATDPQGPHRLLIPAAQAEQFQMKLANIPADKRVKWARHKIKSGESLLGIARLHGTSVDAIRIANKIKGNNIYAGKTLIVPTASQHASAYVMSQNQRASRKQQQISRKTKRTKTSHTVKNGDSFWSISRKYKVGVKQLASWNNMSTKDTLSLGKKLIIWKDTQSLTGKQGKNMLQKVGYEVRSGDSLSQIANRFNVSIKNITRWNNLDTRNYLKPGQRLTLYVDPTH